MAGAHKPVTVVGIGDDGCAGLSSRAHNAVVQASVLVGGERQLEFFPEFPGRRVVLKGGLKESLEEIRELAGENQVAVLASGDPLFFGIGGLLVKQFGPDAVEILPALSSMQLAFARIGKKWDDANWISLHGRPREGLLTRLKRMRKVGVFTDEINSPANIAAYLREFGESGWRAWVCENLGGADERVRSFASLAELAGTADIATLNVLVLERDDPAWRPAPAVLNHHEDEFAKRVPKKGLITKKEVRLLSIAELNLRADSVIWDIGAASGSIAIESALLAPEGRAYAIELDPESIEFCHENLKTFGVDNVHVVEGRAPEILDDIQGDPDAVFVGGSKGSLAEIIRAALYRLRPGGRLVVNAITFENVQEAYATFREMDLPVEIMQLNVARAVPLARFMRYEAQNPIHIFSVTRPEEMS